MNFWGPNTNALLEWVEQTYPDWDVGAMTPYQLCQKMNEALGMEVPDSTEIEAGAAMWLEAIKRDEARMVVCVVNGKEERRLYSRTEVDRDSGWRGTRDVPVVQPDEEIRWVRGDLRPHIIKRQS